MTQKTEENISPEIGDTQLIQLNDFDKEIEKLIPTCGTVELTEQQKQALFRPVNEQDIEIRPDGLIYLPWVEYVSRLKEAFGLNWAIVPQGMPKHNGDYLVWGFHLIIQGKLAGFAIGEQEYNPDNAYMSWSDACEGAKSNALMRLCKGIGISLELWKPSFVNAWKEKYAESYWDTDKHGKRRKFWRKKPLTQSEGKKEVTPYKTVNSTSYTNTDKIKPLTPSELVRKIQGAESLPHLKNIWSKHHKCLDTYAPRDKELVTKAKDGKKKELLTTVK
ncbi:MAG: hypothetical protein QY310_09405 [Candidatus Jettenia sp. CY-1]|nr:MAG: hypothetical protein QY310_09405 [Candidatus Jettenia sp. CY-1]